MAPGLTVMNPYGYGYGTSDEFFNAMPMSQAQYTQYNQNIWQNATNTLGYQNSYNQTASSYYNQNFSNQLNINNQASVVHSLVEEGLPTEALEKIDQLASEIKNQPCYQGISDQNARNLAIQQLGGLDNLRASIEQNSSGSFATGMLQMTDPLGIFGDHSKSSDEVIADLQGTKVSNSSNAQKTAGNVVGVIADAGVIGATIGGAAIGTSICPVIGTIIGGLVGFLGSEFLVNKAVH